MPEANEQQLRTALEFCLDIATEAYPNLRYNLAAECALRHIKRKASEALKRTASVEDEK